MQKVINQLLSKNGGEVCVLLDPEAVDLDTWLCVYKNPPTYPQYTVRKFSVPSNLDYEENDISDSVMSNEEIIELDSIESVASVVLQLYGQDLENFQSPWKSGCPF